MYCPQIDVNNVLVTLALDNALVKLAMNVTPELVVHLFGRLQEEVDGNSEWGRWEDVLVFLAKLADNPGHRILGRWVSFMNRSCSTMF